MKTGKRIEIVIAAFEAERVVDLLEQGGVSGHTLIRDVSGKGERGRRLGDDPVGASGNVLILAICASEKVDGIVASLEPVLRKFGGIVVVSDCSWLHG
jgi:nitrogen regulatory protein PII